MPNELAIKFEKNWLYTSRKVFSNMLSLSSITWYTIMIAQVLCHFCIFSNKYIKTFMQIEIIKFFTIVYNFKSVNITIAYPKVIRFQSCISLLIFNTVNILKSLIQLLLQRPEAWSITFFKDRLFALYKICHTWSIFNLLISSYDIDFFF